MANATYKLVVAGTHYNQFVENVLYFQGSTADGSQPLTEGQDLIGSFRDAAEPDYLGALPPTYTLDRYAAYCVNPNGPSQGAHLQVINEAKIGTFGVGAVSENLCPAVNLIPPNGVKSGGRIYMPCVAKTAIDNNQFVAGYITAINSFLGDMIGGMTNSSITWKLAIYSKKLTTSSLALNFSLSAAIGFQGRRRKPL